MCLRESNDDDVMGSLNDRFRMLVVAFDMLIIVVSLHSYRDGSSVSARDLDDVITRRHPASFSNLKCGLIQTEKCAKFYQIIAVVCCYWR